MKLLTVVNVGSRGEDHAAVTVMATSLMVVAVVEVTLTAALRTEETTITEALADHTEAAREAAATMEVPHEVAEAMRERTMAVVRENEGQPHVSSARRRVTLRESAPKRAVLMTDEVAIPDGKVEARAMAAKNGESKKQQLLILTAKALRTQ